MIYLCCSFQFRLAADYQRGKRARHTASWTGVTGVTVTVTATTSSDTSDHHGWMVGAGVVAGRGWGRGVALWRYLGQQGGVHDLHEGIGSDQVYSYQ